MTGVPPLPPPPPGGLVSRWRTRPPHCVTVPMRVVGAAQFAICGLLVLGILFALVTLALAVFVAGPLVGVIVEAIIAPVVLAAVLIVVHIVIAVAMFEMRRRGIVLFALVSAGYVVACVAAIIEGQGGTEDAQRSRLVLSLVWGAVLALLNALAVSQWRHAR